MSVQPMEFLELSTDVDSYSLSFSQAFENQKANYAVLTDAIYYRMEQIIDENELTVLSLTVKVDCFDFGLLRQGYVEMDSLFHSESVTSLDAYLYDSNNMLKGKASCTLQYEKERRVPAH